MAKIISSLVLFAFLFGLINSQYATPTLSRKANVKPLIREEVQIQQPIEYTYEQPQQIVETTFIPQPVEMPQPQVPTGYGGLQQTMTRDSSRKSSQSSGLKKVLSKETVTTQVSSGGYGLQPTLVTVTVPPPMPVPSTPRPSYGLTPQLTRERPLQKETTFMQTPSGYASSSLSSSQSQSSLSRSQSSMTNAKSSLKLTKPIRQETTIVKVTVDPCTPNPCQNSGLCTKVSDMTFTCTCSSYFYGDYCEFQKQIVQPQVPVSQPLPSYGSSMSLARETTTLSSCSENPCLNEGECLEGGPNGFTCKCPWGWTGLNCEICITECASNPCPSNKKCRAFYGGGYECICPSDRTGANCEIQNDVCSLNPCLNGGVCKPGKDGATYRCTCQKPFAGINCESQWQNPCTAEVLRNTDVIQFENPWDPSGYIICTDIDQWVAMTCSGGTIFNTELGHCVPESYEAPMCPPKFCLNDGECITNELTGELGCTCKSGFTGKNCEINIDECQLYGNPCGAGQCIDQINTYYCYCPNGGIGLDCTYTIQNPCTPENLVADLTFFTILSADNDHYLRCSDVDQWTVHRCAQGLFWDQTEKTCTVDKPSDLTGLCVNGPCKNGGVCTDLGSTFRCECKNGFAGELCDVIVDYCASNPCMNGGRCLPYAGGYTCVCPDKIIDDCCCNGIINPCPEKSKLIPGVNNYYPHIFPHKYIHCDFDSRAFVRNCAHGTRWSQEALSCLPEGFILNTTSTVVKVSGGLPVQQTFEQTYTQQLPQLTQTVSQSHLNQQRVKLIQKEQPKFFQKQTTTTIIERPVEPQTSYTQLPKLTQTVPVPTPVAQPTYVSLPKMKPLPVQRQQTTVTIVQQPPKPVHTVPTQPAYNTLPQLTQTVPVPKPLPLPVPVQPILTRTQVKIETPSSYSQLPTIEKPATRILPTPQGYGSQSTQESTQETFDDQTFVDGSDDLTEERTSFEQPSEFSELGYEQTYTATEPVPQPQMFQQQRTIVAPRPVQTPVQRTQATMMSTGGAGMSRSMSMPTVSRTLTQQPVQQPYRRL